MELNQNYSTRLYEILLDSRKLQETFRKTPGKPHKQNKRNMFWGFGAVFKDIRA